MDKVITSTCVFTGLDDRVKPLAIVVRDGRILQVLERNRVEQLEKKGYLIEDWGDRFICPGFIDAHQHVMHAALFPSDIAFEYLGTSEDDYVQYAKAFADKHQELKWVIGHGWRDNLWSDQKPPTKKSLDNSIPDRPCALYSGDSHTLWLNSKALELLEITDETTPPDGGYFDRDSNGELTGVLREAAGMKYITQILSSLDRDLLTNAYKQYFMKLNKMGITSVSDVAISLIPGSDCVLQDIYLDLLSKEQLTVRVHLYPTLSDDLDNLNLMQLQVDGQMISAPGFKQFFDGVSSQHTAWISEDYANARYDGDRGAPTITFERMRELVMLAGLHGHSVRIHAIGDKAVSSCIDIYEEAIERYGRPSQGTYTIEHLEDIDPSQIKRMADLGIAASVQPPHITIDTEQPLRDLGKYRQDRMWPFRTLLNNGVNVAFGTDAPVVPPNSLEVLWCATERSHPTSHDIFRGGYPEECLTRSQAIKCYTYGSAVAEGRRDIGVLAAGMLADIGVWDTNLIDCNSEELLQAKCCCVYLSGSKV